MGSICRTTRSATCSPSRSPSGSGKGISALRWSASPARDASPRTPGSAAPWGSRSRPTRCSPRHGQRSPRSVERARMRILVALGGNALLRRGEEMTAANQRRNVRLAAEALGPLGLEHQLVITHGNGPQVGLLALQSDAYSQVSSYPLDVLGAQTEGMIGYIIEQELGNLLPFEQPLATILSMVEVDPDDPAWEHPTKPIGPVYAEAESRRLAAEKGWTMAPDGDGFRRVVPSPQPQRIFQIRPVKWLLEKGCIVICAGGGGIPTMYAPGRQLHGVDAVVDKDRASCLLARELEVDLFIMATDASAVYLDWGRPTQRAIRRTSPQALAAHDFASGSMGPKVEAAVEFAERTGRTAAIGSLADVTRIARGEAGTLVTAEAEGLELYSRPPF